MSGSDGRPVLRFFGGLLVFLGATLALLSGLCTAVGLAFEPTMAIAIGVLPIVLGAAMWLGGLAMIKEARPPPRPVLPPAHFTDGEAP